MTTTAPTTDDEDACEAKLQRSRDEIENWMKDLPTVEELAGPIVGAIYRLRDITGLAWHFEFLDEASEHETKFVALIEDVAALVEANVAQFLPTSDHALAREVRRLVFLFTGADDVCFQHHQRRGENLANRFYYEVPPGSIG